MRPKATKRPALRDDHVNLVHFIADRLHSEYLCLICPIYIPCLIRSIYFADDPEKQSFCSCGGPASDVMIQCTLCLDWFHSPKCVPPPKILSTGPKKSESENSNGNDDDIGDEAAVE